MIILADHVTDKRVYLGELQVLQLGSPVITVTYGTLTTPDQTDSISPLFFHTRFPSQRWNQPRNFYLGPFLL